jgi:hypothetical protein
MSFSFKRITKQFLKENDIVLYIMASEILMVKICVLVGRICNLYNHSTFETIGKSDW